MTLIGKTEVWRCETMVLRGVVVAVSLMLLGGITAAQERTSTPLALRNAPEPPDILSIEPDSSLREEVASLISRLDYPLHAERNSVTHKLMEINAPALPQLRDAYLGVEDLEVRMRIEEIVHNIYFAYYVFNRNGFLGIRMRPFLEATDRDIQLPEGRVGMLVNSVIPDTGAMRAGLEKGDVIISINDVPLRGAGRMLQESFGAAIRTRHPGETIVLTVVRGTEVLTLPATLGRTPQTAGSQPNMRVVGTTELYHALRREFPQWWEDRYLASADSSMGRAISSD